MERPAKRPRIGSFLHGDDEDADDELFLDPHQVNAKRDPAVLLEQSRAVATFKLKSRWENVFEKYEKDFTGADDIINFYTDGLPEVEVDNGHLRSLADADDAKSVAASESADLDEEERILHGKGAGSGQLVRSGPSSLMPRAAYAGYAGRLSGLASLTQAQPRLSTMFSSGLHFPSLSSFGQFKSFSAPVEPIWNAPELPAEAFNNRATATAVTKRRVAVKALVAAEDDGSDDDDIIMGSASSWMQDKGKRTDQSSPPSRQTSQDSSPAVVNVLPTEEITEPPHIAAISVAQEVGIPSERKKRGRPRRVPQMNSSAEGAVLVTQPEAMVIPDSDTELLEPSPVVEDDVDRPKDPNGGVPTSESASKPAMPLVRIEVQLLRRCRPDIAPAQAAPRISLLPSLSASDKGQPIHDSSALVVRKRTTGQKKGRASLAPSIPIPRTSRRDNSRRHSSPPTRIVQLKTPENSSPTKPHEKDEVVLESQEQPVSDGPGQKRPAAESATEPAARTEHFSRNAIDNDYHFSDEEESWVPLSRVRKSAKQIKESKSTSRRALVRRVPKTSAFPLSSPSIRVAFPAVKKGLQPTSAKTPEETLVQQPGPAESMPLEVSAANASFTPDIEGSVLDAAEHPKPASPRVDDSPSSPHLDSVLGRLQTQDLAITPSSRRSKEKPAAPPVTLVTPSPRHSKAKATATPSASRPSTSQRSILSLLSDSDEDELSLSLDQISPLVRGVRNQQRVLPIRSRSTAKQSSSKRMSMGSYARVTPKQKTSRLSGGWKSASSTTRFTHRAGDATEAEDRHRTPGGTMRRCGEDGFKCERDFCFACL